MKILQLVKKNYKLLVRNKSSALVVLLGPLVLMVLISLAFNTSSLFDIRIATYSPGYSDLSNSLIAQLQDDAFKVVKAESKEICTNGIESGEFHICALIPENFNVQSDHPIEFYVDKSRINLVYSIINSLSSKVSVQAGQLSTELTSALVNALNDAEIKIQEKSGALTTLAANLDNLNSKASTINNDLQSLNLSNTVVNITAIEQEIETLKNETGLSESFFTDLDAVIAEAKATISNANGRLTSVQEVRNAAVSELTNIKEGLSTGNQDVQSIQSTLNAIQESINAIEIRDVNKIVNPVKTEIKSISPDTTHLSFTFPALVMIVVMFSGILLGASNIVEEKSSKAYFRNFITPTNDTLLLFGQYLFFLIVLILQLVIIFTIMSYITKTSITQPVIANVAIIFFLTATIFILIGMFIGYVFRSEETTNIASISIGTVLLFFSNIILPIETVPLAIRKIAQFNPVVMGESALRQTLLFQEPLSNLSFTFYLLVGYVVLLALLTYLVQETTKRRGL